MTVKRLGYVLKELFSDHGYEVVVVGHSLGAGTATLLSILLKEELGLRNVRGIGFATPPVTDLKTAKRCSEYVLSVALQTDVVTVASLGNLRIMGQTLKGMDEIYQKQGYEKAKESADTVVEQCVSKYKPDMKDLFVPGRVVYIYHDGQGVYESIEGQGDLPILKAITMSPTMIDDHLTGKGYIPAIQKAVNACKN